MLLHLSRWEKRVSETDARDPSYAISELNVQVAILATALAQSQVQALVAVQFLAKYRNLARDPLPCLARRRLQCVCVDLAYQSPEMLSFGMLVSRYESLGVTILVKEAQYPCVLRALCCMEPTSDGHVCTPALTWLAHQCLAHIMQLPIARSAALLHV